MKAMQDFAKYECPFLRGKKYFYWKNSGLQNHSVLYMVNSTDPNETPVVSSHNNIIIIIIIIALVEEVEVVITINMYEII